MRISRPAFVAAASLACLPLPLAAQEGPPVPLHARVRVTTEAAPQNPYVGTFRTWDGSSLVLEGDDRSLETVSLSDIARLELSEGTRGHALLGGVIGLGVGVAITGVLALTTEENENTGWEAVAGILGVPLGLLGLLVGSQIKSEDWERVPLDSYRTTDPAAVSGRP